MRLASATIALLAVCLASGCTQKRIPGLDIELDDTPDNRALVEVVRAFRTAYENKDVDGLVALASERFYEDSGTPETEDDYNYEGLRQHFSEHFKLIKKVQLKLELKKVDIQDNDATVDYRYVTRYLMALPVGEKWQVTDEINRLELVREDDRWKVLSGF
jgi:hypothetical protein